MNADLENSGILDPRKYLKIIKFSIKKGLKLHIQGLILETRLPGAVPQPLWSSSIFKNIQVVFHISSG
jgi:hypothetical protein